MSIGPRRRFRGFAQVVARNIGKNVGKIVGVNIVPLLVSFEAFAAGPRGYTPLVLDCDRDRKIAVTDKMVTFDINGDDSPDTISWIAPTEGFLAIDLNNNGSIDSGAELFGGATRIVKTGAIAKDGFKALRQYDENGDGVIDRQDAAVFGRLVIWQDQNTDGVGGEAELIPISATRVMSFTVVPSKTFSSFQRLLSDGRSYIEAQGEYSLSGQKRSFLLADVVFFVEKKLSFNAPGVKER